MTKMLLNFFLYFLAYGLIGRIFENIYVIIYRYVKNVDLDKPIFQLPFFPAVYGLGAIIIVALDYIFNISQLNLAWQFVITMIVCALAEYYSAVLLEFVFGKNIWWDYSKRKFNLHGRIYLANCIYFGIGGILILSFIQPTLSRLVGSLSNNQIHTISIIGFTLIVIDNFYSTLINHRRFNFDHLWRRFKKKRKAKKNTGQKRSK